MMAGDETVKRYFAAAFAAHSWGTSWGVYDRQADAFVPHPNRLTSAWVALSQAEAAEYARQLNEEEDA